MVKKTNNNFSELIEIMTKHEEERFLFVSSNFIKNGILEQLDNSDINYTRGVFFNTVATNIKKIKIQNFDMLVFYSPRDIASLYENFPKFQNSGCRKFAYCRDL